MNAEGIGFTTVCKWKGGRTAAFSLGGDDSLRSQLYFAIPEMDKRGLRGTWWVNPGRGGKTNFKNQDDAWATCWIACYEDWKAAATRGHDFANHTMHHLGAASYTLAEQEIRETAEAIWQTNPRQRLQLFDRGGGTDWIITDAELAEILAKYDCVWGRGGGTEDPTWGLNLDAEVLCIYVDTAIREGSWHHVAFHGIGPNCEWGGQKDGQAFCAMLDHLVEKQAQIWCGTHTEVHKYDQERSTSMICVMETSQRRIRLKLTSAKDAHLYDYPLTVETRLPAGWRNVSVTRAGVSLPHTLSENTARYEAVPSDAEITLIPA